LTESIRQFLTLVIPKEEIMNVVVVPSCVVLVDIVLSLPPFLQRGVDMWLDTTDTVGWTTEQLQEPPRIVFSVTLSLLTIVTETLMMVLSPVRLAQVDMLGQKFKQLVSAIDGDGDGTISRDEFKSALQDEKLAQFASMGGPPGVMLAQFLALLKSKDKDEAKEEPEGAAERPGWLTGLLDARDAFMQQVGTAPVSKAAFIALARDKIRTPVESLFLLAEEFIEEHVLGGDGKKGVRQMAADVAQEAHERIKAVIVEGGVDEVSGMIFDFVDTNDDGYVLVEDLTRLKVLASPLGSVTAEQRVEALFGLIDADNSGQLSIDEVLNALNRLVQLLLLVADWLIKKAVTVVSSMYDERVRAKVKELTGDEKGTVTQSQFVKLLTSFGVPEDQIAKKLEDPVSLVFTLLESLGKEQQGGGETGSGSMPEAGSMSAGGGGDGSGSGGGGGGCKGGGATEDRAEKAAAEKALAAEDDA